MFKYLLVIFITFLTLESAFAKFVMNVGIVYKKGGPGESPLVSEYHTSEEVYDEPVIIRMRDELVLKITATFSPEKEIYGPSKKITIQGELIHIVSNERKKILMTVSLDEKTSEIFEFSKQRIVELSFHPYI